MITFENLLKLVSRPGPPNLCVDSRTVKPGDIFIAVKGAKLNGHNFIKQAIEQGAKFIVIDNPNYKPQATSDDLSASGGPEAERRATSSEFILVDNSARAAALLAHAKKGFPADKLTCLAVTGTNGKTTTAYLVRSIIQTAGSRCGLISTVLYDTGEKLFPSKLTTPDSFTIADITNQMVEAGAEFMVTEASSHALDQHRLAGIRFAAAAFTNLTGDHLDYHKTKDNYLAAKTKLFSSLDKNAAAILNKQSPESEYIAQHTKARLLWYSIDAPADLTAHIEVMNTTGTTFALEYQGQKHIIKSPLLGKFNISNCLAAAGLAIAAGISLDTICSALSNPAPPPGRLQKVPHENPFTVLVDYAHTDDALQNVLETLKPLCAGKLIVVFGCGGDRDKTKRPRMAKVAEHFADLIIVTSDNPRTENPQTIISEIIAGFTNPNSSKIKVEPDRYKAIGIAVENAQKNDVVLIAGKGHENYQILADKTIHFSDQETATEFLKTKVVSGLP
jgi:UDP-N-acetylmuramoyl-L-alanyl-D-glutamate--2,6-diaminopimelate ligase